MPGSFDSKGMFTMTFSVNPDDIINAIPNESILTLMERRAYKAMFFVQDKIKERLNRPGTGKWYKSKTGFGTHRASRPGEPPAPDRREYRDSWRVVVQRTAKGVIMDVRSAYWTVFGRRLELGGWSTNRFSTVYIAPRPHVAPTWDEHEDDIRRILEEG